MTSIAFYASDGRPWEGTISREDPQKLEIEILSDAGMTPPATQLSRESTGKPEIPKFHVGDRVRALVRSPFSGTLLLSMESDDFIQQQVVEMTKWCRVFRGGKETPRQAPKEPGQQSGDFLGSDK